MNYTVLAAQLRSTVSRSKRELLDNAAESIEELLAEKRTAVWHYGLPAEDNRDTLLLVASGRGANMILKNAVVIGCYMGNGTWMLEDYPEIDDAKVLCWTPTPYWEGQR